MLSHRLLPCLLVAGLAGLAAASPLAARPVLDRCPAPGARPHIEVLPFQHSGDTCDRSFDQFPEYGEPCVIQGVSYRRPDAVYQVRLNPGHRVSFRLGVATGADLALALVRTCGDGTTCVASSPDFIGAGDEEIASASYPPGTYFLVVDAASEAEEGACGPYTLEVTGTNPTPDLHVSLDAPEEAVAGNELTYELRVRNDGTLDATGVVAEVTLPEGTTLTDSDDCREPGARRVVCEAEFLAENGGELTKHLTVAVAPGVRGRLEAKAGAQAVEGLQDLNDCQADPSGPRHCATAVTPVRAVTDLALAVTASSPAVAGCRLVYTLTVTNGGPSEATEVAVTSRLPVAAAFPAAGPDPLGCPQPPPACSPDPGISCTRGARGDPVECRIGRMPPGSPARTLCLPVRLQPTAPTPVVHRAEVAGRPDEENPTAGNLQRLATAVGRWTDLSLGLKATPAPPSPPDLAEADGELVYGAAVTNGGPSASRRREIEVELPAELTLDRPPAGCRAEPSGCSATAGTPAACRILCPVRRLGAGEAGGVLRLGPRVAGAVELSGRSRSLTVATRAEVATPDAGGIDRELDDSNDAVILPTRIRTADLDLAVEAEPELAAAGTNLLYTVNVSHGGGDPSRGGRLVVEDLDPGLRFVASPDGCEPGEAGVTCPIGPLAVDEAATARFVVHASSSLPAGKELPGIFRLEPEDPDPDPPPETDEATASIETRTHFAVRLVDAPDPVAEGEPFQVVATVTNLGPSDTEGVELCVLLPLRAILADPGDCQQVTPGDAACRAPAGPAGEVLRCTIDTLAAGTLTERPIQLTAPMLTPPGEPRTLETRAEVAGSATPVASEATTVSPAGDVDLALGAFAHPEPARIGDLLRHRLTVEHRGPGAASVAGVEVVGHLPVEIDVDPLALPPGCGLDGTSRQVTCELAGPGPGGVEELEIVARLEPGAAASGPLEVPFEIRRSADAPEDPVPGNDGATVTTTTFEAPELVLPYFEAGSGGNGPAALLAVRDGSDPPADVEILIEAFADDGSPLAMPRRTRLPAHAVESLNLRELPDLFASGDPTSGYVGITPVSPFDQSSPSPADALSGEHFQIDVAGGRASGTLLARAGSRELPRDLCRRWAVRFLNGSLFDGGTDFVFWVPENPGGTGPITRGRVYSEAGDFVQEIAVHTSERAFTRSSLDDFADESFGLEQVPLLASFGSVEWELQEGTVGHFSTVHRAEDGFSVGVPGTCLDPADPPSARRDALVLPYFEVDLDPEGRTTLFAVRNDGPETVPLVVQYFDEAGDPLVGALAAERVDLPARAIHTVNLRDRAAAGTNGSDLTGFVTIGANPDPTFTGQVLLSGDYFRVEAGADRAAGEALVRMGPGDLAAGLCQAWSTRLIHGGAFGGGTELIFYAPKPATGGGNTFSGERFQEDGSDASSVELDQAATAFAILSSDPPLSLGPDAEVFGSIEWTFPEGRPGHVSTLFRADGRYSVLIPGICLP